MPEIIQTKNGENVCFYCTLEVMRRHGSDFSKVLAELWWRADYDNKGKIERTWEQLFEIYARDVLIYKIRCGHL